MRAGDLQTGFCIGLQYAESRPALQDLPDRFCVGPGRGNREAALARQPPRCSTGRNPQHLATGPLQGGDSRSVRRGAGRLCGPGPARGLRDMLEACSVGSRSGHGGEAPYWEPDAPAQCEGSRTRSASARTRAGDAGTARGSTAASCMAPRDVSYILNGTY